MGWRLACGIALHLAACSFSVNGTEVSVDAAPDTSGLPWWDPAWGHRRALVVTTGSVVPDKGYADYTVRLEVAASTLTGLAASCDDLRVVRWDGTQWTELARHVLGCGTPTIDLRFALPLELGVGATWREAFLYYDHPAPAAPAPAHGSAVYLWWDPATTDRSGDYARGRMDAWLSAGHDNSLAWNSGGYYTYNTGDDSQSSYRRTVDERDVLVETSWFHTGCYAFNMQSGVCARGIIASGTAGTEQAAHYYCTSRAQNPNCADDDQALYDGDVVDGDNETISLQGLTDPPPIVPDQWRAQALAVFGTAPTQLRFWDADAAWESLATPPATALQATGVAANDHPGRGFAGIMTAQDTGRVRHLVIRRYVEPEPIVSVEAEQAR